MRQQIAKAVHGWKYAGLVNKLTGMALGPAEAAGLQALRPKPPPPKPDPFLAFLASGGKCRKFHYGPVCAVCVPGTVYTGKYCGKCKPKQAWVNWPAGNKAALLVLMALGFVGIIVVGFLKPLIPAMDPKPPKEALTFSAKAALKAKQDVVKKEAKKEQSAALKGTALTIVMGKGEGGGAILKAYKETCAPLAGALGPLVSELGPLLKELAPIVAIVAGIVGELAEPMLYIIQTVVALVLDVLKFINWGPFLEALAEYLQAWRRAAAPGRTCSRPNPQLTRANPR